MNVYQLGLLLCASCALNNKDYRSSFHYKEKKKDYVMKSSDPEKSTSESIQDDPPAPLKNTKNRAQGLYDGNQRKLQLKPGLFLLGSPDYSGYSENPVDQFDTNVMPEGPTERAIKNQRCRRFAKNHLTSK